jgi:toxin ParE1/3/4
VKSYAIADAARSDLDEIWCYFGSFSLRTADRWLDGITSHFHLLAKFPEAGTARSDIRADLRFLPVGDFLIFYRVVAEDIEILRVFHGSRNYGSADFD